MPVLLLVAMLALSPASTPLRPADGAAPRADCPDARTYYANKSAGAGIMRRLDQLPPGRLELTVQREVDGCPIPAILREGISGRPDTGSRR